MSSAARKQTVTLLKVLPSYKRPSAVRLLIPKPLLQKLYGGDSGLTLAADDAVKLAETLKAMAESAAPNAVSLDVERLELP